MNALIRRWYAAALARQPLMFDGRGTRVTSMSSAGCASRHEYTSDMHREYSAWLSRMKASERRSSSNAARVDRTLNQDMDGGLLRARRSGDGFARFLRGSAAGSGRGTVAAATWGAHATSARKCQLPGSRPPRLLHAMHQQLLVAAERRRQWLRARRVDLSRST